MARPLRHLGVLTLALLGPLASGQKVFGTHTPCADCPPGVGPTPVPITAQFQEFEVCTATTATVAADVPVETIGFACAEEKSTFVSLVAPAVASKSLCHEDPDDDHR